MKFIYIKIICDIIKGFVRIWVIKIPFGWWGSAAISDLDDIVDTINNPEKYLD